ncbi:MAG: hypothetical protein LBT76_05160 [Tannerella sp.]|jgi:hypothetical protein|nr:hypothetical protein [Tannerella sp.]
MAEDPNISQVKFVLNQLYGDIAAKCFEATKREDGDADFIRFCKERLSLLATYGTKLERPEIQQLIIDAYVASKEKDN